MDPTSWNTNGFVESFFLVLIAYRSLEEPTGLYIRRDRLGSGSRIDGFCGLALWSRDARTRIRMHAGRFGALDLVGLHRR